jgi:hypothetical protein
MTDELQRYGLPELPLRSTEKVRSQNFIALRNGSSIDVLCLQQPNDAKICASLRAAHASASASLKTNHET